MTEQKTPYVEPEEVQEVEKPEEVQEPEEVELDIEGQIVVMVAELAPEISPSRLSRWLTTRDWDKILGDAWAHHPTVEDKAKALVTLARCDIRPKAARAGK